jgi:long-subunit fatty acid transport protein
MHRQFCHPILVFLCLLVLFSSPSQAQLTIGQYQDEAPLRTWNTFGIPTAPAIGMGETQFALVADASATVINPARMTVLPKFSCSLSGSYTAASLNKYAVVNTGVLISEGNSALGLYALDFAGITFTLNGWAAGISIGLLENYDRPSQSPDYVYAGEVLYLFQFEQTGYLRNINLSLARKFGDWLSIGIGLNSVAGSMEKSVVENMFYSGVTISDRKKHGFTGFYVNGGLTAEVDEKLTIAAVFRTPYTKQADSESRLRYDSPQGGTDIRIEASAKNTYKQPLVLGIGADYRFSPKLRVASDLSYFRWSSYSITYFDENIDRDFADIVKVAAGLEYTESFRLFQQNFEAPLRAGLSYDPQPVKEPNMHYMYYTLGFGLYWKRLKLDAGAMFGSEKGSGRDLYGRKVAVTLSFFL